MDSLAAGITLIETVVMVAMIGILTAIAAPALPYARAQHQLIDTRLQLTDMLARAQNQALNEERTPECIAQLGSEADSRVCSNVGVVAQDKELVMFADISGDRAFSSADYVLQRQGVPAAFGDGVRTVIFEGVPPTVHTYAGSTLLSGQQTVSVTLQSGSQTMPLLIGAYGRVETE